MEGLPDGFNASSASTAEDATAVTVNVLKVDAVVAGAERNPNKEEPTAIGAGSTMITNTGYVKFTASKADTYTVTVTSYFGYVYVNCTTNIVAGGTYYDWYAAYGANEPDSYETDASGKVNQFVVTLKASEYIIVTPATAGDIVTIVGATPDVEPEPDPVDGELRVGQNTVSVTASEAWTGKAYTFTAKEAATYTITVTDENAYAWLSTSNMGNPVIDGSHGVLSYKFTLTASESIVLYFATVDFSYGDTYYATIAKTGEAPAEPDPEPTPEPTPEPRSYARNGTFPRR